MVADSACQHCGAPVQVSIGLRTGTQPMYPDSELTVPPGVVSEVDESVLHGRSSA